MAKSIKTYNATLRAIRKETGVSQREAQQVYRAAKVRLGHAPSAKEVRSPAVHAEAKKAGAQLRAAERRKQQRIEKAIEHAKAPARGKGPAKAPGGRGEAPKGRGGALGGGADRGGGGGGAPGRGRDFESWDFDNEPDWDFDYDSEDDY